MPLTLTSDETGKLTFIQTGEATQDNPVRSIDMDYSTWPVKINVNMVARPDATVMMIDTKTNDPDKKIKGRESPMHMVFNDVENFVDAIKILKINGITPDVIAKLEEKYAIAKSNRPPRPNFS